ncbi:LRR domain containing protein [Parasponia andersonii]|uniref:LRR domain containing protein n=1 Tax=Parasponia andersonii TaxID=3476 RepID=A0A2P5D1B6_PARAD|nr:LRR domain containing protein [Parasponia andersonii]
MLPKSIGKLHNPRTLNLVSTLVQELPVLRSLQHIYASYDEKILPSDQRWSIRVKIQEGFGLLVHLGFTKDQTNLSKLKALGVRILTTETSRAICAVIRELNHLEYLSLGIDNSDEILDVESISTSPPRLMRKLSLVGRINKFPHWISELSNLQGLVLSLSKLADDVTEISGGLAQNDGSSIVRLKRWRETTLWERLFSKAQGALVRRFERAKVGEDRRRSIAPS